jgi:release factor glutamine methyltransferase
MSGTEIASHEGLVLSPAQIDAFEKFVARRAAGESCAVIVGHKEFRYLDLFVNENVLVPRPETETLVEAALAFIDASPSPSSPSPTPYSLLPTPYLSCLDLCTGSGAIACALKEERPDIRVSASDISLPALSVAKKNAAKYNLDIEFIESDLFENISGIYDIIVSNPPYIPCGAMNTLPPEVRREPHLALFAGEDGLVVIKKIIEVAHRHLSAAGSLLLECSPNQIHDIACLLEKNFFHDIKVTKDLGGQDRVISCTV